MNIRTLVVEDDPMVSNINCRFLERIESYEIIEAVDNGEKAFQYVKQNAVDLILLDVYMPYMGGMELLRKVRKEGWKLDVILITAANSPEIIEEAMRLGVVDCILKPFDFPRFQNALQLYKKRFSLFHSPSEINQEELDSLQLRKELRKDMNEPPKGIDPVTLNLVRSALRKSAYPMSMHEISEQLDLSKITLRKYLDFLAAEGEIELHLKYSDRGRPTKLYSYHADGPMELTGKKQPGIETF